MADRIELLKQAYAAFNQDRIQDCLTALDPDVEWIEPPEFPGGGAYHGHAGVAQYLTQSRHAWAEIHSEPEEFITAGDKVVVYVHTRVRPEGSAQITEGRIADVYTFRGDKAVRMQAFVNRQDALKYAGIEPGD